MGNNDDTLEPLLVSLRKLDAIRALKYLLSQKLSADDKRKVRDVINILRGKVDGSK